MVLRLNLVSLVPVSGVTSIRAQVLRRFGRVCVAVTSFRVCYVVSGTPEASFTFVPAQALVQNARTAACLVSCHRHRHCDQLLYMGLGAINGSDVLLLSNTAAKRNTSKRGSETL